MSHGHHRRASFGPSHNSHAIASPSWRLAWPILALVPLLAMLAGCEGAPAAEGASTGYGYVCHAGFYQCTLPAQYPVGNRCQCPGLGAPSYGRIG